MPLQVDLTEAPGAKILQAMRTAFEIIFYCGHRGVIVLPEWRHRDRILPRVRCASCCRLGAENLVVLRETGPDGYRNPDDLTWY